MGDMGEGGAVKNLKKVRDVLCERPHTCIVTIIFEKKKCSHSNNEIIMHIFLYDVENFEQNILEFQNPSK